MRGVASELCLKKADRSLAERTKVKKIAEESLDAIDLTYITLWKSEMLQKPKRIPS
jgi:hypothetical protein